jgi:hypothetical protein
MMSQDVIISEGYTGISERNEIAPDARLERNAQEDLHTAIDLAFKFVASVRALHPLAERQIKAMMLSGNLL